MGKNIYGGAKHKKFAKKNTSSSSNNRLRTSQNESEIYAIAKKALGNNQFECKCIDGVNRKLVIRGKFSGKYKRDNMVTVGAWLLVGLRGWSSDDTICDLIEIYSENDKNNLREKQYTLNWSVLSINDELKQETVSSETNTVEFKTEDDYENIELMNEITKSLDKSKTLKFSDDLNNGEEVYIDDI